MTSLRDQLHQALTGRFPLGRDLDRMLDLYVMPIVEKDRQKTADEFRVSDLRERLMLVATDFNEWGHIRTPEQVVAALLPIIEAELLSARNEAAEAGLRSAQHCEDLLVVNKLLEQTIEVLEGLQKARTKIDDCCEGQLIELGQFMFVHDDNCPMEPIKPLLDKLKEAKS